MQQASLKTKCRVMEVKEVKIRISIYIMLKVNTG